jgi:hypothetical protein
LCKSAAAAINASSDAALRFACCWGAIATLKVQNVAFECLRPIAAFELSAEQNYRRARN